MILYESQIDALTKIAAEWRRPLEIEHINRIPGAIKVNLLSTHLVSPIQVSPGKLEAQHIKADKITVLPYFLVFPDGTTEKSEP